jgi:hypothetical protein
MLLPPLLSAALAAEPDVEPNDTAQGGVVLEEQRYARLDGDDDEPARPRWRRRSSGDFVVWSRPDGTVQRAHTLGRGHLLRDRHYDLLGVPSVSIAYDGDRPTEAVVHLASPVTLDLSTWEPYPLPGVTLHAPAAPVDGALAAGEGRFRVFTAPAADVYTDAFRDEVADGCGCWVVERTATWVDGRPGVRVRLEAVALGPAEQTDLWAVPTDDGTWVATYTVPPTDDPDRALAYGRALVGLVRWAPDAAADAVGSPP